MKFVLFTLLFTGNLLISDQSTKYNGNWVLQSKSYVSGPQYGNAVPEGLKIAVTKDSLSIETFTSDQQGNENRSQYAIPLNGKDIFSHHSSGRKLKRNLSQSVDKKGYIITTTVFKQDNDTEVDFTRIESLLLHEDGTLHLNRKSVETNNESWEANGIYRSNSSTSK